MERSLTRDLAFGFRTLGKTPAFTLTAIVTIGLGIGATTAIFSVVNAVLLKPLPYADAGSLVFIQGDLTARNLNDFPMAPGDYPDLVSQGTMFQDIGGLFTNRITMEFDEGEPERIPAAFVTTNALGIMGARAQLGRLFIEADGTPLPPPPQNAQGAQGAQAAPQQPPPPPQIGVISHGFWQRRFGGDPAVLGRIIRFGGGGTMEIVGVLAPDVELLWPPRLNIERRPDVYGALRVDFANASRINVFLRVIGRLKPGVSVAQAQGQVDGIVADLRERFPIKNTAGLKWRVEPMHDYIVADVRREVLALMGAVVFVLLIACANVANLLLVRASSRERELVVRAALGASRGDLIRQMLAESLVIAGGGFIVGISLAVAGTGLLRRLAPRSLPRVDLAGVDVTVFLFTAVAALAAAMIIGLIPALRASRPDAGAALRSASRVGNLAAGRRLRNGVVIAEVALSFVLLVGSGLMIRSFVALMRVDPGFNPEGVLTMQVQPNNLNTPEARRGFIRDVTDRLSALPGVTGVTAAFPLPLENQQSNARWGPLDAATDPTKFQQADVRAVQPGFFDVMQTRLIEGRTFDESDNAPDRMGIVIDQVLANKAFPGRSAVGQQLLVRVRGNEPERLDVIGVVEHQRHAQLASDGRETIYVVDGFFGFAATSRWIIRTNGDPMNVAAAARGEVARYAPRLPITDVRPMQALVDDAMAPTKFALMLIGIFAVVAAVLAAVGLYGVLATAVRQRTAEIGIRMTFGAPRSDIFKLIIGQGLLLSGAGIAAGVVAAIVLTRVMTTLLVGVKPTDPMTFVSIIVAFMAVAALAAWLPARRAARLDPAVALRDE